MRTSRIAIFAAVVTFWLSALPIFAVTRTWTGASSALWSEGGNWSPAGVPTAGDSLSFPDSVANLTNTNDLPASTLFTSIAFPGSGYTISGNLIRLSGGMTGGFGINTFSVPIQLTASQTFTAGGESLTRLTLGGAIDLQASNLTLEGQCTVSGAISGSGGVTIANTGSIFAYVVLSGVNTYTGPTTNNRYLVINGTQPASAVISGGILNGIGTIGALSFPSNGQLSPGAAFSGGFNGTGILHTGNISGNVSIAFELNGTTPGTGYDQLDVTGTVNLNNMSAGMITEGTLVSSVGQVLTIIANDGSDAVTGTFTAKPQGSIITITGGAQYQISYQGGDGNDVTLTCTFAPKTWTGAGGNNLWSNPANWSGGVAPVADDGLAFPDGAAQLTNVNDLPSSTQLTSIAIGGSGYMISGNLIRLSGGMTGGFGINTFSVPIQLTASQTFTANGESSTRFTLGGAIDLQANTLTLAGQCTVSGAMSGTGGVTIANTGSIFAYVVLSGMNTYTGTTTNNRYLVINGMQPASAVVSGGILNGIGTIGALSFPSNGELSAGAAFSGGFNGTGIFHTGNISGSASINFELNGTTPGTSYDQLDVTGTVNLNNMSANMITEGTLVSSVGQVLTIIANDGSDAVTGSFTGKPQGTVITISGGAQYQISYQGGDGNDVTLTCTFAPRTWTGAGGNNLWSNPANWSGSLAPVAGDALTFPDGAAQLTNVNDLPASTQFTSIVLTGAGYSISGNLIRLSDGLNGGVVNTFNVPIQLTASQTFTASGDSVARLTLVGAIDLQGHNLTLAGQITVSGAISGTGGVTIFNTGSIFAHVVLSGVNTYTGTTTNNRYLIINGTQSGSAVINRGILNGIGTIGALTFDSATTGGQTAPGTAFGSGFNGTGVLHTGNVSAIGSFGMSLNLDVNSSADHDRLDVAGTVNLNLIGLSMSPGDGFGPAPSETFTIISNDEADAVAGAFVSKPQNSNFNIGSFPMRISYRGGDGNDVVVTALANTFASATSLLSSKNPASQSESITFTATVTGSGTATGTVIFTDSNVPIGSGTISDTTATLTISTLSPGNHTIRAEYQGDLNFVASTSSPVTQLIVGPASTATTTITRAHASLPANGTSTTTITVTARDSNGNQLLQSGGPVSLSTTLGTLSPVTDHNDGTYTATLTSSVTTGTATVSGMINGAAITSTATVEFVPNATRLEVTAPSPVLGGSSFQVTVRATDAGGTTATAYTGTISFTSSDGAALLPANYTFTPADNGQRIFDVVLNTAGNVMVGATDTVTASITGNVSVVVRGVTDVSLNSSANPSVVGQSVTITASVNSPVDGTITGTVGFYEQVGADVVTLGSGAVSTGSATYTTSTLAHGSHTIFAVYEGDAYFNGNISPQLTQVVNPAPFGPPPLFSATATGTTAVALSWGAVSGAINYEVWRSSLNGAYTLALTTSATSTNDTGLNANTTYLYRVRTIGSSGPSAFSAIDAATTIVFTDPLISGQLIRAVHLNELRIAVNAMRAAVGLSQGTFTDPTLAPGITLIRAVHITELRLRLNEARSAIPLPGIVYTDPTIAPGTVMKAAHVVQIRAGAQ